MRRGWECPQWVGNSRRPGMPGEHSRSGPVASRMSAYEQASCNEAALNQINES
jgi:hypothetical protein